MNQINSINIARDFSKYPAGRNISDGPYSGEKFRKDILIPILKAEKTTKINFDGARGYGSSFLEEAFGGLIRIEGYTLELIKKYLSLEASDTSIVLEVKEYLKDAHEHL